MLELFCADGTVLCFDIGGSYTNPYMKYNYTGLYIPPNKCRCYNGKKTILLLKQKTNS